MKTNNRFKTTKITNRSFRSALLAMLFLGILCSLTVRGKAADLDELVQPGAPERIATGFRFTEGPVWHPDGYLLFTDIAANTIYKWIPDGTVEIFRAPSGHSNGLTFDREGRLIACEHSNRQVSRTELDGTVVSLAGEYNGSRFNSPNDAVVKSDGSIYFTDPPYGLDAELGVPGTQELLFQGVYRLLPDGKTLELLVSDIHRPNGLAFSPDENVFYVSESEPSTIHAFDVQADGSLQNHRSIAHPSGWPDGITVDVRGNLYVTTNTSSVQVYSSSGKYLGNIAIGAQTTNCAFGGTDNRTLFVTNRTSLYRVHMKVRGAHPILDFNRPLWPPDFNGDSKVNIDDLVRLIEGWGQDQRQLDIAPVPTGDGIVDVKDLEIFMQYWGQDVNDSTLIAHWALDETDGGIAQDRARANDAFVIGSPVWQPTGGQVDGALQFDGVDDFVIAGSALNPANGPFSVIAWVKGGAAGQTVISEPGVANWLGIDPSDGFLMTELAGSSGPLLSETIITDGEWHRISFVWDGSNRTLYVDSIAVAQDMQDSLESSDGGLYIGAGKAMAPGTYFSGLIDDVRIYNRVVSP